MASYVYTYIGNNYDTFATDRSGNIYDASMHIELSFTVDNLLINFAGNAAEPFGPILITSFRIFDGVNLFTETSVVMTGYATVVNLNTDSFGNVNQWDLRGRASNSTMTNIGDTETYMSSSYVIGFSERDYVSTDVCVTMPFGSCINGYYDASVTNNRGTWTVSAVPVPPALWLFGSGLLGLVGISRRKIG